ncbi:MAG: hypothetical protein L6V93_16460 [Clostridiales bacterium]|nr:MAG: hypothetical protein L6V93_16460 [Clostridiales bacterium]
MKMPERKLEKFDVPEGIKKSNQIDINLFARRVCKDLKESYRAEKFGNKNFRHQTRC